MTIVKPHNSKIDTGVRLLSQQGYSAKEIANELGTSLRTIFNYASDLGVKIGRKYHSNNAPTPLSRAIKLLRKVQRLRGQTPRRNISRRGCIH
jgi:hypothetical protein